MTPEQIAALYFVSILAVAMLGMLAAGLRAYARDAFRQRAFAIRNELFDFAAAGHVSFDDPAYWRLRQVMNATIRFTHRLTVGEAVLPVCLHLMSRSMPPPKNLTLWRDAVREQPKAVQDVLLGLHRRFGKTLSEHVVLYNPLAAPVIVLCYLFSPSGFRASRSREVLTDCAPILEEKAVLVDEAQRELAVA